MPKTEHDLVAALLKLLKSELPSAIILKHANYVTAGIPDITVTLHGRTSWWEVKHATPRIVGTGIQLLTARRLASQGDCHYIVYKTANRFDSTHIVKPSEIGENGYFIADEFRTADEYNHGFVYRFIRQLHDTRILAR
jgi:hypothetical protein